MISCAAEAPQPKKKRKRRRAPRIVFPDPDRHRKPEKIPKYAYPPKSYLVVQPDWDQHDWGYLGSIWKIQRKLMRDRLFEEGCRELELVMPSMALCRVAIEERRLLEGRPLPPYIPL